VAWLTAAAVNRDRAANVALAGIAPAYGRVASMLPRDGQLELGAGAYYEAPLGEEAGCPIVRTRPGRLEPPAHTWTRGQSDHTQNDAHVGVRRLGANCLLTR
jgi:hypothetical protein